MAPLAPKDTCSSHQLTFHELKGAETYHCVESVQVGEIRRVIHTRAGLDEILGVANTDLRLSAVVRVLAGGEGTDVIRAQELLASDARNRRQAQVLGNLGQRLEGEERGGIDAQEFGDGGGRQLLGPLRSRQSVLQDDLESGPPRRGALVNGEDEAVAIPDAHLGVIICVRDTLGQTKLGHGVEHDLVGLDEDARALLDPLGRVIEPVSYTHLTLPTILLV